MSGLEVEAIDAGRAAILQGGGRTGARSRAPPQRRPADGVQGRRGHGRAARHRLRRAQRRGRHEGALRARRRHAAGRSPAALRDQAREHARRREPGHAVLGARAGPVGRSLAACWRCPPMRRSAATCARCSRSTIKLLTLKLTPNRADCLSVLGVAREVAALTAHASFAPPDRRRSPRKTIDATFPVRISDPTGCGRFTGRVIRNVERRRADAGLDEAAPGARGPALDLGAGGRHQLRDARTGPAAARLRPGQAAGRHRRALRPQGRAA